MDRHAIFVDVGYLLGSGAELLTGDRSRHRVRCDYRGFVADLIAGEASRTSLPLLRVYWYDASITGQPEYDQEAIAECEGVRLRLGRVVHGQQKGVDSRIVRDLIVLSRDRAIAEATLLAGDEDLCEGVREAQDQGVHVTLLGVPGVNQSRLLVQQADARDELSEGFIRAHFNVADPQLPVAGPQPGPTQRRQAAANQAIAEAFAVAVEKAPEAADLLNGAREEGLFDVAARRAGVDFARQHLAEAAPSEINRLRQHTGWQVPADLDRLLLRFADQQLAGQLWERPELKVEVRAGFWEEVRRDSPGK